MRNFCTIAVVAALSFAPTAWGETLTPGKPAGVHTAQRQDSTPIIILGVAVAAAAIAVAVSNNDNNNPPASTTVSPTTTS